MSTGSRVLATAFDLFFDLIATTATLTSSIKLRKFALYITYLLMNLMQHNIAASIYFKGTH